MVINSACCTRTGILEKDVRYGVVPRDRAVELLLRACSMHPGPSRAWAEDENGLPQALSDTVVCCSPAVAQNKLNKLS